MSKQDTPLSPGPEWLQKAAILKEAILDKLEALPEAERSKLPAAGEWSAAGVVEHLALFEENMAGPWRQKLLELPASKRGAPLGLASGIVSILVSKTDMRVPTLAELEPKGDLKIGELKERWAAAQVRLVAALPDDDRSAWILHPALGALSSRQAGKLLTAHLQHHLRHWPAPK